MVVMARIDSRWPIAVFGLSRLTYHHTALSVRCKYPYAIETAFTSRRRAPSLALPTAAACPLNSPSEKDTAFSIKGDVSWIHCHSPGY
jgi:hypothetical protein